MWILLAGLLCSAPGVFAHPFFRELPKLPQATENASREARAAADGKLRQLENELWHFIVIELKKTINSPTAYGQSFDRKISALAKLEDGYFSVISQYRVPEANVCAWLRIGKARENLAHQLRWVSPPADIVEQGPEMVEAYFAALRDVSDGTITGPALAAYEFAQAEAVSVPCFGPSLLNHRRMHGPTVRWGQFVANIQHSQSNY